MSAALQALPRPKSHADAEREFMRVLGDPRRMCKFLSVAVTALAVGTGAMAFTTYRLATQQRERVVVHVDGVGRAQAIGFTSTGEIREPEVKFFLTHFAADYYGRNRVTIHDDFIRSMMFLSPVLATARMNHERETQEIEKFIVAADDEVQINVSNIILRDMTRSPYAAQVDMEKVYRDRNGNETKREKSTVSLTWEIAKEVSNAAIPVNPLGFTITSIREDQAFK